MKKLLKRLLITLSGLTMLASCSELTLSEDKLEFPFSGGTRTIRIETSEPWKVESISDTVQIHVSKMNEVGISDLEITVEAANSDRNFLGSVRIKTAKNFYSIDISRQGLVMDGNLGLSVEWATSNVGANSPEQYGDYFPFDDALKLEDAGWRLPTLDEFSELHSCRHFWGIYNGVEGEYYVGKNGHAVFLPAAGYRDFAGVRRVGSDGLYWSSTAGTRDYGTSAYCLYFYSVDAGVSSYGYGCYTGRSVRLVRSL